jgi:hypothetical protein
VDTFRIFVLIIFLISTELTGFSQCFENNSSFQNGEVLKYQAYYNWGFIWLNAGYVEFKVKPGKYLNKSVYYFDAYSASHKSYDWIFKVRDTYKCYLDQETLKPLWFYRKNYEGGFEVGNEYFFDQEKKIVYTHTLTTDRPFKIDTLILPPCSFDVLSLIYVCRNLDFAGLRIGDSIPVTAIIDNEIYNLHIRYLGKEDIKTRDDIKYKCIKFSALLVEGTIFKGGEDLFVWVTDDRNRIPVLVNAKILIGSVKAYLERTEGLCNPVEARVE